MLVADCIKTINMETIFLYIKKKLIKLNEEDERSDRVGHAGDIPLRPGWNVRFKTTSLSHMRTS